MKKTKTKKHVNIPVYENPDLIHNVMKKSKYMLFMFVHDDCRNNKFMMCESDTFLDAQMSFKSIKETPRKVNFITKRLINDDKTLRAVYVFPSDFYHSSSNGIRKYIINSILNKTLDINNMSQNLYLSNVPIDNIFKQSLDAPRFLFHSMYSMSTHEKTNLVASSLLNHFMETKNVDDVINNGFVITFSYDSILKIINEIN